MAQSLRFVRFLEREGRIKTPGDLDEKLTILDEFLDGLRSDGYKPSTIREYRNGCIRLVAWLHLSRIALRGLNPDVYARFRKGRFHCSIPGCCTLKERVPSRTDTGTKSGGSYRVMFRLAAHVGYQAGSMAMHRGMPTPPPATTARRWTPRGTVLTGEILTSWRRRFGMVSRADG